ncbi:MAG: hypothetical protein ACR2MO_03600 [Acidimicrobiales bacterium]
MRSRSRTAPSNGVTWRRTAHVYWSNVLTATRPSLDRSHISRKSPSLSASVPARPSSTARWWANAARLVGNVPSCLTRRRAVTGS